MSTNTVENVEKVEKIPEAGPPGLPVVEPRADVHQDERAVTLLVDLPGVDPDGLSVDLDQDRLTVAARVVFHAPEGTVPYVQEVGGREYRRIFRLGERLDREGIKASFRHGVLRLEVPVKAERTPRKVHVEVG